MPNMPKNQATMSGNPTSHHANSIRTATIGVGYLGHFHAEKYAAIPTSKLIAVCDINHEVATQVGQRLGVPAIERYQDLIGKVDAVSIATPTQTHFEIAHFFLSHKIDVLLEKTHDTDYRRSKTIN